MGISASRRAGGGPGRNGGKGRQRTGPLRKIVDHEYMGADSWREILECGHRQYPVRDLIGETNAVRRRCWQCKKEAEQKSVISG